MPAPHSSSPTRYRLTALWNRLWGNDIFISYSALDRPVAQSLETLLKRGGYRVFRDDSDLTTGEHLGRLLAEVRRSTMFLVLVSEHSVTSDWVHRELSEYLKRPEGFRQVAPVFLNQQYPRNLPARFKELADFHGLQLTIPEGDPEALQTDTPLLADLTSQFHAVRRTTLRRWLASAVIFAVTAGIAGLYRQNQRDTRRDELLKRAEIAQTTNRFDEAELALARAWELDSRAATFAAYREARSHRSLERPVRLPMAREEGVLAVDESRGEPYVVIQRDEDLVLLRNGRRTALASACSSTPLIATAGPLIVWTCGNRLASALADAPNPRMVELPAEPAQLFLTDGRVSLLFREGRAAQVGAFLAPALQPVALHLLRGAPDGGEMNFCPATPLIWSFAVESGKIVFRHWDGEGNPARPEPFSVPDPVGRGELAAAWISRVIPAAGCDRFFVDYAPFTLGARSSFEMLRIRPDSPRPLDRFDPSVEQLVPAPDKSGVEAIYRTSSKELRVFLLTSPVVLSTRIRTLAADIEKLTAWPGGEPGELWTLALDQQFVSIYRNQQRWSSYPLGTGAPVRAVASPDGKWLAVEGETATLLWRRAGRWNGTQPPMPESIEAETAVPR